MSGRNGRSRRLAGQKHRLHAAGEEGPCERCTFDDLGNNKENEGINMEEAEEFEEEEDYGQHDPAGANNNADLYTWPKYDAEDHDDQMILGGKHLHNSNVTIQELRKIIDAIKCNTEVVQELVRVLSRQGGGHMRVVSAGSNKLDIFDSDASTRDFES